MWNGRKVVIVMTLLVLIVLVTIFTFSKTDIVTQLSSKNLIVAPVFKRGPNDIFISMDRIMRSPFTLQQYDDRLIKRIREKYLHPPAKLDYKLEHPENDDPSMGQSRQIRNILGDKVENGFFIECGALDGETRSNTLVFEKRFGWKGVLIEGDPENIELVKQKNRKVHTVSACLSTQNYPNVVMFEQSFNTGKISNLVLDQQAIGYVEVQCLPLYSILLALNTTEVDYFSLDVEGAELGVLNTIPWDKVNIKTLSVEFVHGKEGKDFYRQFMESKGYKVYTEVIHPFGLANDFIFYRNDITPKIPSSLI